MTARLISDLERLLQAGTREPHMIGDGFVVCGEGRYFCSDECEMLNATPAPPSRPGAARAGCDADDQHEQAECVCEGSGSAVEICPATLAIDTDRS